LKSRILLVIFFTVLSAQASAGYAPAPELIGSPVLLVDYATWVKESETFSQAGSETRAYKDLVEILYDREVGRDWGAAYFPEANERLSALRAQLCQGGSSLAFCSSPKSLASDADVQSLERLLLEPSARNALSARWGVEIEAVTFPNSSFGFDLIVSKNEIMETETAAYWDLTGKVDRAFMNPMLLDTDTYLAGFDFRGSEFPGHFAYSGSKIVLNDWLIRNRAMQFAFRWKRTLDRSRGMQPLNPVDDAEAIQLQALYDENQAAFVKYYEQFLPEVSSHAEIYARFIKERAASDFPEEAYQWVAYDLLSSLARMQTGYFDLARKGGRAHTSERQKSLESLLTLQRYSSAPRFFLLELTGLAEPLASHGVVLDETVDPGLAITYFFEELKAILGLDGYASANLFPRMKYSVLVQELFSAYYLEHNQPQIYKELKQPDGTIRSVLSLPEADQLRLFREYIVTADGKPSLIGIYRLAQVFANRVQLADLRELADRMHEAHAPNFH
jgi:hypothetical protein